MALSQADIYTLARSAGLSSDRARIAAAVAMAESGGDPNAHNARPPDDSYGLWQINMLGALGPPRRAAYGLKANSDLFNPQLNARAMSGISSQGANFGPWSTYGNGSYRKYLSNDVGSGVADASFWDKLKGLGGAVGGVVPDALNPLEPFKDFGKLVEGFAKTAAWVSNAENWLRVVYVIGGVTLATAGLVMVLKDTSAGRTATKVGKTAAKVAL